MQTIMVSEENLRRNIRLDKAGLQAVEEAFQALAEGRAEMPPIMRIDVPEFCGEVDIKGAYIRGWDSFAVKMSSGFFDNQKKGLPSASGLMVLLSSETGIPKAVFLDNGYLTEVRTGLAGAVAAKYGAKDNVNQVGVIGAGAQARFQLEALRLVRKIEKVAVYNHNRSKAEKYAAEMTGRFQVSVQVMDSPEEVVRSSDLVVTTTPSQEPLIQPEWLHEGLHITAMGSDAEHKNEVAPGVLKSVDHLVCDSKKQCLRLGELHHAVDAGEVLADDSQIRELGEIIRTGAPVRKSEKDVTLFDLTGAGVQDTAIARLAFKQFS